MIEKDKICRFIDSLIGIELDNHTYYKGTLKEVSDQSITLGLFNGKTIIVSIEDIHFLKVLD